MLSQQSGKTAQEIFNLLFDFLFVLQIIFKWMLPKTWATDLWRRGGASVEWAREAPSPCWESQTAPTLTCFHRAKLLTWKPWKWKTTSSSLGRHLGKTSIRGKVGLLICFISTFPQTVSSQHPPPLCVCSHFLLFSISTLQKASLVKAKARDSSITQHELYTITHREDDIIFLILAFKKISSAPGSHFSMSLYIATWYSVISHTYIPW